MLKHIKLITKCNAATASGIYFIHICKGYIAVLRHLY